MQSLEATTDKQNGKISNTNVVPNEGGIKDEKKITSGGVPKNGEELILLIPSIW